MADPRFFENLGPFSLAQICEKSGIALPANADGARTFFDLADLAGAGVQHVTFFSGAAILRDVFTTSLAGLCLVPQASSSGKKRPDAPPGMIVLETASVGPAFAAIAQLFYPRYSQPRWPQTAPLSPEA